MFVLADLDSRPLLTRVYPVDAFPSSHVLFNSVEDAQMAGPEVESIGGQAYWEGRFSETANQQQPNPLRLYIPRTSVQQLIMNIITSQQGSTIAPD